VTYRARRHSGLVESQILVLTGGRRGNDGVKRAERTELLLPARDRHQPPLALLPDDVREPVVFRALLTGVYLAGKVTARHGVNFSAWQARHAGNREWNVEIPLRLRNLRDDIAPEPALEPV